MRKIFVFFIVLICLLFVSIINAEEEIGKSYDIVLSVYTDKAASTNHYFPTGAMGDWPDIKRDDGWTANPHSGFTCIRFSYSNKATRGERWAGVYWQDPPDNWNLKRGGYDLSGASKLTFWARGEKGGERIEEFKVGGIQGSYPDTDSASIGPIILTNEWKQYTIDLKGKNLSHIGGGFAWATNLDVAPEGVTFYLDDIQYEK